MKLKPVSYVVLGMLRLGATSGYAIKKAADASTSFFWPVSLAQVYPELARLEEGKLVIRHEDPHGARSRSAYELTEKGEEALLAWLRSPQEAEMQWRIEGMLRLFFVDALPKREQLEMALRGRERVREYRVNLYPKEVSISLEDLEEGGIRAPALTILFAESILLGVEEWLAQLAALLEAELQAERSAE
jgi:DNA-binding PadR family transcriptional regulator